MECIAFPAQLPLMTLCCDFLCSTHTLWLYFPYIVDILLATSMVSIHYSTLLALFFPWLVLVFPPGMLLPVYPSYNIFHLSLSFIFSHTSLWSFSHISLTRILALSVQFYNVLNFTQSVLESLLCLLLFPNPVSPQVSSWNVRLMGFYMSKEFYG